MNKVIIMGGVIVCAIVAMASCRPIPEQGDYSLIVTMVDGNEYAIDHNLTRDDCYSAIADTFGPVTPKGVYCEAKQ